MSKYKKVFLGFLLFAFASVLCSPVFAQEDQVLGETAVASADISAEDLDIPEQNVLPGSFFYFLKEWSRNIRSAFTFNSTAKMALESKFSNERLMELKKLAERNADSEIIKKASEKYETALDKIEKRAEKIKQKASESETLDSFLEKFARHQVLQEKILEKLEAQVPEQAFEKIQQAREKHMQKFGEIMQRLEDRENKFVEKIENAFANAHVQDINMLDKISENLSEDLKSRIAGQMIQARERIKEKVVETLNQQKQGGPVIDCTQDSDCPSINCIKDPCPINKCENGGCIIRDICESDSDCPQPNCRGNSNCIGQKNQCVEGVCKMQTSLP